MELSGLSRDTVESVGRLDSLVRDQISEISGSSDDLIFSDGNPLARERVKVLRTR